jgi:membrane protein
VDVVVHHHRARGAEINAEMEHQTARDTTSDGEKPMGHRGERMANDMKIER